MLTNTADGQVTATPFTSGASTTTPTGNRVITLVSPIHIYVADAQGAYDADIRTIAGAAQMRLTVPEPTHLALQLVAVAGLLLMGALRWRRARGDSA